MDTAQILMAALSTGTAFASPVGGSKGDSTPTGTGLADTIHAYGGEGVAWALSRLDEAREGSNADRLYGNRYGDTTFGGNVKDRLYGAAATLMTSVGTSTLAASGIETFSHAVRLARA